MPQTHSGSCLCGTVRYQVDGDFELFYMCHCSRCRKNSGSAHGANLFSRSAQLTWLSGEDSVQTYAVPQSRHARCFCRHCGSAMPLQVKGAGILVVPAGSLDSALTKVPDAHVFVADKAEWDQDLEQCRRFDRFPPGYS